VVWKDLVTVLIDESKGSEAYDRGEPSRLALAQALSHGVFEKRPPQNLYHRQRGRFYMHVRAWLQGWRTKRPLFSYAMKLLPEGKIHVQFDFGVRWKLHFRASHFAHEALFSVKGL
jgi:hypothetical protein